MVRAPASCRSTDEWLTQSGGRAGSVRTQRPAPAAPAGPTARNHQCDAARETRFEQQAKHAQQGAEGRGGARGSEGEGTGRGGQGLGWRTAASIGIRAAVAGSIPLRCRSPRRPTAARGLPSPKLPLHAFHLICCPFFIQPVTERIERERRIDRL